MAHPQSFVLSLSLLSHSLETQNQKIAAYRKAHEIYFIYREREESTEQKNM